MDPSVLLFQVHCQGTRDGLFWYTVQDVSCSDIDGTKCRELVEDFEKMKLFSEQCYSIYNAKYASSMDIGSVDVLPVFWVNSAIGQLHYFVNVENVHQIKLSNGCCDSPQCPINLFYNIIIEQIRC